MLTHQQIFDKVAAHLLAQNTRAVTFPDYSNDPDDAICRYRGDNGTKCAVGCLIDDEFYSDAYEGVGIGALRSEYDAHDAVALLRNALISSGVDANDETTLNLLARLQSAHDNTYPGVWQAKLRDIAQMYGLEFKTSDAT